MNKYKIFILGALLVWGCHGNPKSTSNDTSASQHVDTIKHSNVQLPPLDKGVIIDTVHCTDAPMQRYAIYIPTNYTATKKWPVIYFFDPHGVGNLPLKK
jgi:hypothetical protein